MPTTPQVKGPLRSSRTISMPVTAASRPLLDWFGSER